MTKATIHKMLADAYRQTALVGDKITYPMSWRYAGDFEGALTWCRRNDSFTAACERRALAIDHVSGELLGHHWQNAFSHYDHNRRSYWIITLDEAASDIHAALHDSGGVNKPSFSSPRIVVDDQFSTASRPPAPRG